MVVDTELYVGFDPFLGCLTRGLSICCFLIAAMGVRVIISVDNIIIQNAGGMFYIGCILYMILPVSFAEGIM